MNIKIDRSRCSPTSQRSSAHYDERALFYEGIAYHCKRCGKPCVFTAEQQKTAYEEQKRFVWWIPTLCKECKAQRQNLRARAEACQLAWNADKHSLSKDRIFLQNWRVILKELETYGRKGSHPSNVIMISKLLNEME